MGRVEVEVVLTDGKIEKTEVFSDATIEDLAIRYQSEYKDKIVLSMVNGKLRELSKRIKTPSKVSFITMTQNDGKRTYRRGVILLMQKAAENLWGEEAKIKVFYSLGQGYYCESIDKKLTEKDILNLKKEMKSIAKKNLPITKESVKTDAACELFHEKKMYEKENLLKFRRSSRVNLYNLDGMVDYFYGYMVPSTSYLEYFDIETYDEGFVLLFPNKDGRRVEPLETSHKLHMTLRNSRNWSKMLDIGSVAALNEAISAGKGQEIILTQEAIMEERIGNLAQEIKDRGNVKFVMIAGPSSSGKTSFANRLSIQLAAKGLNPHPLSLDDYYADRQFCPRNPDGSFDFECLEALDVKQFNEDMSSLLNGGTVDMPSFNFKSGKREYRGKKLKLNDGDVLVIEGIHGLNEKLSYLIPKERKFKIYISALTQLNIDEHNPLPTTDGRLLRRIIRDARTRGTNAMETIQMWPSVRNGEENNIFPFQEGADVFFNSALIYEIAVLKVYAEPLLFQIPKDAPEYLEAKRLLKFLDYFLPLPAEGISHNSLIREFVGGSCFNV